MPPPKTVLMIIDHLGDGGAQHYVMRLVEELKQRDVTPIVCSLQPSGAKDPVVNPSPSRLVFLSARRFDIVGFFLLCRLIKRSRPDVIHTHLTASNFFGVIAGKLCGVNRIFAHDHSGSEYANRFPLAAKLVIFPLERIVARFIIKIFAVSNHVASFSIEKKKLPPSKIVVLPNWVDPDHFNFSNEKRERIRAELQIPNSALVIGAVGRLSAEKGLMTLIDTFVQITTREPNAYLLLAGEGPDRTQIASRISEVGLSSRILLLGRRNDIEAVYSAFDIFALPSKYETFSLAVLEAMHCGLPVIASDVGGIPDLIDHGVSGILIDPADTDQLSAALGTLLSDSTERHRLGHASKLAAENKFDKTILVDRLLSYYSSDN